MSLSWIDPQDFSTQIEKMLNQLEGSKELIALLKKIAMQNAEVFKIGMNKSKK